jgi:hypothetical protein
MIHAQIDVYTDSTASVGAMTRGGRASMIDDSRSLLAWQLQHGATVRAHWLRRCHLELEDGLSRVSDLSFAGIRRDVLAMVWSFCFGDSSICRDMFASGANAVVAEYVSRSEEIDSTDVDGIRADIADMCIATGGGHGTRKLHLCAN